MEKLALFLRLPSCGAMHFFYQTAKELAHVNFFLLHMRKLIHSRVERIGEKRVRV